MLDPNSQFRIVDNNDFEFCETYPPEVIVPKVITDAQLANISKFRTKGRIPTLTYFDKPTGCSIWRSSQPKTGFTGDHCDEDILLLENIGMVNGE